MGSSTATSPAPPSATTSSSARASGSRCCSPSASARASAWPWHGPPPRAPASTSSRDYTPGDLGFDPLGLKPGDEQELFELQTKELNNGHLAMIAIAGFVAAELKSPGTEVFQHLFETLDYDLIKEVDLVEDIVGAPETPLPELDADTLSNLGSSRSKLLQATPASTTPH